VSEEEREKVEGETNRQTDRQIDRQTDGGDSASNREGERDWGGGEGE
jgi:hypothetical protein